MKPKVYMTLAFLALVATLSLLKMAKVATLIVCAVILVHLWLRSLRTPKI